MSFGVSPSVSRKGFRSDDVLVRECLLGSESAWEELIDKYKKLVFSIPIKSGYSFDDAGEIFQSVCYQWLRDLVDLRQPKALPAWLIRLTIRRCASYRKEQLVYSEIEPHSALDIHALPDKILAEAEREQIFRGALAEISPECSRLVDLLFLKDPPASYDEAAAALGLARGSIGATRMRCLDKLRRALEKKGLH